MCLVSGMIGVIAQFNEKDDFCVYIERFEQYCTANRITEEKIQIAMLISLVSTEYGTANRITEEKIQIAMLISLVSTEVYKTLRDWCFPENPKNKSLAEIKTILKQQYSPQINVYRERIQFYRTTQTSSESIMEWFTRIKRLAINCEFNNLNEILKDKFISGMKPGLVLDKLVEEKINKKLEELVQIAITKEGAVTNRLLEENINKKLEGLVQIAITKEGAVTNATGGRIQAVFEGEGARNAKQGPQQRFEGDTKFQRKIFGKLSIIVRIKGVIKRIAGVVSMCKGDTVKIIKNEDIETLDENHINTLILVNKVDVNISNKVSPILIEVKIDNANFNMKLDTGSVISAINSNFYNKYLSRLASVMSQRLRFWMTRHSSLGEAGPATIVVLAGLSTIPNTE
ncbi:hypothetical protein QE152_g1795 [Popillia japonica]|uniref:Retrotransposon gag domain-containing protein n=1 Tax=Popillia japonica TaxID=7064 RepID=A0AAW1N4S9_POPJA